MPIRDGVIDLDAVPTNDEISALTSIFLRLQRNNMLRTCIIFKVKACTEVTNISHDFRAMNYCTIDDVDNIRYLRNRRGYVDLAFITVNANPF